MSIETLPVQWRWVMERGGKWHAMLTNTHIDGTAMWEPMKGGHQFIKCRWTKKGNPVSVQVFDYSPTNPLPQKCCRECMEQVVKELVVARLGAK